ncbi:MAG TPA: phosphoglucomutase [Planctomycetota bacterium]|nr:phosphoglucomutase [Planctomycetota bacterium]
MPGRMFGTAGIRGVTNRDITPELALKIALAAGDWMAERKEGRPSAAVGHDTRYGAEVLARAAASGLASAGVDVQFYGCVPTGVIALNLERSKQDGGILVTGSHLPPDRIGIIFLMPDGSFAPYSVSDDLERRFHALPGRKRQVRPEDIGRIDEVFHPYETYVSEVVNLVDTRAIRARKFKILIDPANGPGSYVAKELFQWFGCEVEMLNYDPSPVPGRPSEPRASTVTEAAELVQKFGCDLGLCLDVDADRALFLTHEGQAVSEDTIGSLFAAAELGAGDVCVTPVTSSGLIEVVCRERKARLEYCGVGQPSTAQAIRDQKAAYAYEESGKYYFPRDRIWTDGLYSGAKLLELLTERRESLKTLVARTPVFHQAKRTLRVEDPLKDPALEEVARLLERELTDGRLRDVRLDGFKRVYDDNAWLLIRASATEPAIRVFSDAPDAARAESLVREGERVLLEALKRVAP